jgi:hypothetical protein
MCERVFLPRVFKFVPKKKTKKKKKKKKTKKTFISQMEPPLKAAKVAEEAEVPAVTEYCVWGELDVVGFKYREEDRIDEDLSLVQAFRPSKKKRVMVVDEWMAVRGAGSKQLVCFATMGRFVDVCSLDDFALETRYFTPFTMEAIRPHRMCHMGVCSRTGALRTMLLCNQVAVQWTGDIVDALMLVRAKHLPVWKTTIKELVDGRLRSEPAIAFVQESGTAVSVLSRHTLWTISPCLGQINCVSVSPDGHSVVIGKDYAPVQYVSKLEDSVVSTNMTDVRYRVWGTCFSSCGRFVALVNSAKRLVVYSRCLEPPYTVTHISHLKLHFVAYHVAFETDIDYRQPQSSILLAAACATAFCVVRFNIDTGDMVSLFERPIQNHPHLICFARAADRTPLVAVVDQVSQMVVVNAETGALHGKPIVFRPISEKNETYPIADWSFARVKLSIPWCILRVLILGRMPGGPFSVLTKDLFRLLLRMVSVTPIMWPMKQKATVFPYAPGGRHILTEQEQEEENQKRLLLEQQLKELQEQEQEQKQEKEGKEEGEEQKRLELEGIRTTHGIEAEDHGAIEPMDVDENDGQKQEAKIQPESSKNEGNKEVDKGEEDQHDVDDGGKDDDEEEGEGGNEQEEDEEDEFPCLFHDNLLVCQMPPVSFVPQFEYEEGDDDEHMYDESDSDISSSELRRIPNGEELLAIIRANFDDNNNNGGKDNDNNQ